jgi:hypothetical protein
MLIIYAVAAAAIVPAPALAVAPGISAPDRSIEQRIVGGLWIGSFLQKDWTFEFYNEGGKVQGRYLMSGGHSWHPLNETLVSGSAVSFSIESKPEVSFSLAVDAAERRMSGTVTVDGFGAIPFFAMRAP